METEKLTAENKRLRVIILHLKSENEWLEDNVRQLRTLAHLRLLEITHMNQFEGGAPVEPKIHPVEKNDGV
jgi:hypothetical protein